MSSALAEAPPPPDSRALCRAIAGLPNDDVAAALVKVTGSAGRWSGTAGLAIGAPGPGGVRFPVGELAEVFCPDGRDRPAFTADELAAFLAALVRDRSQPPPGLRSLTLANGLTVWGASGSCATHVAGVYATRDLSRVLVFAYRPADRGDRNGGGSGGGSPAGRDADGTAGHDNDFGTGIVRAAFDPDAVPDW